MKEWQLTDEQVRALVGAFAPDWDAAAVERVHRAKVDSRGRVDVCFWYRGKVYKAYRLVGTLSLDEDWREMSMEQYRIEKRARLSAGGGEG